MIIIAFAAAILWGMGALVSRKTFYFRMALSILGSVLVVTIAEAALRLLLVMLIGSPHSP